MADDFFRYPGLGVIGPLGVAALGRMAHPPLLVLESFRSLGPVLVGWFAGVLTGSVVITHLYREGNRSILLVAAWRTAFNLVSATKATGVLVGTTASIL